MKQLHLFTVATRCRRVLTKTSKNGNKGDERVRRRWRHKEAVASQTTLKLENVVTFSLSKFFSVIKTNALLAFPTRCSTSTKLRCFTSFFQLFLMWLSQHSFDNTFYCCLRTLNYCTSICESQQVANNNKNF